MPTSQAGKPGPQRAPAQHLHGGPHKKQQRQTEPQKNGAGLTLLSGMSHKVEVLFAAQERGSIHKIFSTLKILILLRLILYDFGLILYDFRSLKI